MDQVKQRTMLELVKVAKEKGDAGKSSLGGFG